MRAREKKENSNIAATYLKNKYNLKSTLCCLKLLNWQILVKTLDLIDPCVNTRPLIKEMISIWITLKYMKVGKDQL